MPATGATCFARTPAIMGGLGGLSPRTSLTCGHVRDKENTVKKRDVVLGKVYYVKVSGKVVRVKLTRESPYGGWDGVNLATGRAVRVRTAGRLRGEEGEMKQRFAHLLDKVAERRAREGAV